MPIATKLPTVVGADERIFVIGQPTFGQGATAVDTQVAQAVDLALRVPEQHEVLSQCLQRQGAVNNVGTEFNGPPKILKHSFRPSLRQPTLGLLAGHLVVELTGEFRWVPQNFRASIVRRPGAGRDPIGQVWPRVGPKSHA